MRSKLYKFLVIFVFLSTILIGVLYLLDSRQRSQPAPFSPGPTATAAPLPTVTPRPTSTPIIPPAQSEHPGDKAFFYGDWETAAAQYQAFLANATSSTDRSAALLGLGKTKYQQGDYQKSLRFLRELVTSYPDSQALPEAYLALAQTYHALGRSLEEAEAYAGYQQLRKGVIDGYIEEKKGDAYAAANQHLAAIQAYQASLAAESSTPPLNLQMKIGQEYLDLEDFQTAEVIFQDVYQQTTNDYQKARADYLLGQIYLETGQPGRAREVFLDAVENYPLSYDSYLSLVELVERGVPVNELDRGLVDYFAGQYLLAIEAFDRYLADPDSDNLATAYYYKAFAHRTLEQYDQALTAWQTLIDNHPGDDYYDNAWEFKAYTEWWYLGEYSQATQTLLDFVSLNPYHSRAAEFLFDAGRIQERAGRLDQAAALWKRVFDEYPASTYARRALFLSGIAEYRQENYSRALTTFSLSEEASQTLEESAQALFWIGKAHQQAGNQEAAQAAWQQAANTDPTGYYSERARDVLQGRAPFTPPLNYDLGFDVTSERQAAQDWMMETFTLPPETNLDGLGPLADDPRVIRGTEFWQLDLYEEARAEFESLREEYAYDPVTSYRLAVYLRELGLYRPAVFAARQVLNAAGMDDAQTMNAPVFFNHIRFGPYYSELVIEASQEYQFHPLLLFSVIRQESLFEGFVRSSAGARGLMQIMPATGQERAERAGWPENYTAEDLYRPIVSVTFGAQYLNFTRSYFEGDLYAALAGYNAGPGYAGSWYELADGDQDLFLEIIRFQETRTYLKSISEVFAIYRRIYGRAP